MAPVSDSEIIVRPAREEDLIAADRVTQTAFGVAAGAPYPETFFGGCDKVKSRYRNPGVSVFVAEEQGEILGSNVVTRWGSFGFFGPFGVRPDQWNRGIAKKIMAPVMDALSVPEIRLAGLYTVPGSPRHIALYQQFGFKPRYLTAVMGKNLEGAPPNVPGAQVVLYSSLSEGEKAQALAAGRELTGRSFEGLDISCEIEAIGQNGYGETLLLWDNSKLLGLASCHAGAGTEAGPGGCYAKFAAAEEGAFEDLLLACEAYGRRVGATDFKAGVNTARREAYGTMLSNGYGIELLGIAMHLPDVPGFSRPGDFILDDWR